MTALTTRQRDLLQLLLDAQAPLAASELAERLDLTARQVNYDLKGLRQWLSRRRVELQATPGVGVALACTPEEGRSLATELRAQARFQLVLTPDQRRQLLSLILLWAAEPMILYHLQQLAEVSRTTVLKDLDDIERWLKGFGLQLERRPNYGVAVSGAEQDRRQAMAALMWAATDWDQPLFELSHNQGLVFALSQDRRLLAVVRQADEIVSGWEVSRVFGHVAFAEAQLGGRFTDDAVLHLALTFAIQARRVKAGHRVSVRSEHLAWLQSLPHIWPVADQMCRRIGRHNGNTCPATEIASMAMHILAAPRNERWPGDLEVDESFTDLIDDMMAEIGQAYERPSLGQDRTLRDGLVTTTVTACLRDRFSLWMPPNQPGASLFTQYDFELDLANRLVAEIKARTTAALLDTERDSLAMLLRAAYIREQPNRVHEVIVVCPSGMATAQLLVARLKAHFPRLGELRVVSLRELSQAKAASAGLIISTVPLPALQKEGLDVIQVHPLLLPEDVERITAWLA